MTKRKPEKLKEKELKLMVLFTTQMDLFRMLILVKLLEIRVALLTSSTIRDIKNLRKLVAKFILHQQRLDVKVPMALSTKLMVLFGMHQVPKSNIMVTPMPKSNTIPKECITTVPSPKFLEMNQAQLMLEMGAPLTLVLPKWLWAMEQTRNTSRLLIEPSN